jgi:hypothetical protein
MAIIGGTPAEQPAYHNLPYELSHHPGYGFPAELLLDLV